MERKQIQDAPFDDKKFTKYDLFKENDETVFVLNLKPGQELPPHKHPERNLYLLGYEGEGEFVIDGEKHRCKKGDIFAVSPEEEFGVVNHSDGNFTVYAFMSKQTPSHL